MKNDACRSTSRSWKACSRRGALGSNGTERGDGGASGPRTRVRQLGSRVPTASVTPCSHSSAGASAQRERIISPARQQHGSYSFVAAGQTPLPLESHSTDFQSRYSSELP